MDKERIISGYLENSDKYVFPYLIKEKKKTRQIITYQNNKKGNGLRNVHRLILNNLETIQTSQFSYAYKKGVSTKCAFEPHMKSTLFIKFDIKDFFENIKLNDFCQLSTANNLNLSEQEIACLFYKDSLSVGFVTSPCISDLYMFSFDEQIEKFLSMHNELHYSRYCDDFLISSEAKDFGSLKSFFDYIKNELKVRNFEINNKKTREIDLLKDTSVSFLGLNLSHRNDENRITISKPFLLKTLSLLETTYLIMDEYIEERNKLHLRFVKIKREHIQKTSTYYTNTIKSYNANQKKRNEFIYLKSIIKSRVAYMKFNSKLSYDRFRKKHIHRFGFEWGKKWLSLDRKI